MKKAFITRIRLMALALVSVGVLASPICASADDFDDDDLYYSPAKAEKAKKQKEAARIEAARKAQAEYEARLARYDSITTAYDAAHPVKSLDMNVDSYNRNGSFLVDATNAGDTTSTSAKPLDNGNFAFTRRLERFHNDSIVSQSNDDELIDYYYSSASADPTVVNVYVNSPYSYGYYNPWYYNPWSWRYNLSWGWGGWYDPWFDFGWGPSWGWSWGWGPGWAPGPWIPGPGYPGYWPGCGVRPWHPTGIPGASRPRRPSYAGASGHGNNYRPGNATNPSGQTRPGNMGRGRYNVGTGANRPGNAYTRPAGTSGNSSGVSTGNNSRGRNNYNSGYNNSGSNRSSSSNRNSYSSPSRPSSSSRNSGSYSSPSRGSFGGGGGAGRSGGGASSGRGRR